MKISTPLKEFFRYESGVVYDEILNIPLRFHNEFASRVTCLSPMSTIYIKQKYIGIISIQLYLCFLYCFTNIINPSLGVGSFLTPEHLSELESM